MPARRSDGELVDKDEWLGVFRDLECFPSQENEEDVEELKKFLINQIRNENLSQEIYNISLELLYINI